MKGAITAFLRLMLRVFFRRIEIVGLEHIDRGKPVLFAVNHPNGLIDPLFLLCFSKRPVSFLAKAPLFGYPLVGFFVKHLDCIPVYRKEDATQGSNEETFARAGEVLRAGGAIAIFPEGTTHSDTTLRPLKSGAARIALGAGVPELAVVPAGIYYTEKQTFRSAALVWFGEPLQVVPSGGPAPDAVQRLTAQIESRMATVTLQADSHAALGLVTRAEGIFSGTREMPLAQHIELRKRFVAGYHYLRDHDPARLERLTSMVRQFEAEHGDSAGGHERATLGQSIRAVVLLPFALGGALVHYPAYRLIGILSSRLSRGAYEMTATLKFVAALLVYPLTWGVAAGMAWHFAGAGAALLTFAALPLLGYAALRVVEDVDDIIGGVRAALDRAFAARAHEHLVDHRRRIRDEIVAVGEELGQ